MPSAVQVTLSGPAGQRIVGGAFPPGGGAVLSGGVAAADAVGSGVLGSGVAPSTTPFMVARTGLRYATLEQAVAGAISGDTIKVAPGTYVIPAGAGAATTPGMTAWGPDYSGIDLETLTVEWEVPGVRPVIDLSAYAFAQGSSGGRTIGLNVGSLSRSFTLRGIELIGHPGAGDPYGVNSNQGYLPGVGYGTNPASELVIEYCKLTRWADGVKNTIYNRNLTTRIRYSIIEDCTGNFLTHGVYVNGALLEVIGSKVHTTYPRITVNHGAAAPFTLGEFVTTPADGTIQIMAVLGGGEYDILRFSGSLIVGSALTTSGTPRGTVLAFTRPGLYTPQNNAGHLIKSRTRQTIVRGSFITGTAGCASCIETPSAGDLIVEGNILFHYGPIANSDENPVIKYGFEENATRFTLGSVAGGPLAVNDIVTGSGGGTARITHIMAAPNTYVFAKINSDYIWNGETITVGGTVRGVITSRSGSPDGSSNDGRTHNIKVAQNTIRKSQPSWNGGALYRIAAMWVSQNMTLDDGTPLPQASVPLVFRNNIVGGTECGGVTIEEFPLNTAALTGQINDLGVYSLGVVPGNPVVNDATLAFAGEGVAPTARSGTDRGGINNDIPAYLVGKTPLQWFVASTNIVFTDPAVNADLDPLVNPNYFSGTDSRAPWRRLFSILGLTSAWGDGCYSDVHGEAAFVGGGHAGYLGNEPIAINVFDDAPAFFRRGYPTGSLQHPISWPSNVPPDGENSDVTSDGRPKSVHSYNILAMLPNGDIYQGPGGADDSLTVGGGFTGYSFIHRKATNDWDLSVRGNDPGKSPGQTTSEYDSIRNLIWNFQGYRFTQVNITTLAPTLVLSLARGFDNNSVSMHDTDNDLFYFIGRAEGTGVLTLRIFNPTTLALSPADASGQPVSHPTTGLSMPALGGVAGAAYDRRRDRILVYFEGNAVYALTPPPGNRMVDPWVLSQLTTSAAVVNPGSNAGNGTFGRFWISEKNNAAYALHALDRPLYCLPLETPL